MRKLVLIALVTTVTATCNFITQQPGQYCHDLAVLCKISDADFFKYNPNIKTDCSNLSAGSRVCCNAGGLAPPPNPDGSCAVYKVISGDNCGAIGGQYGLTIDQINNFNFKNSTSFGGTWGFRGCQNLQPGNICISTGNKGPIPALQKDAQGNPVICGPTASGNGTDIKCPLNACCNEWGQCGLTSDFCDIVPGLNPGVKGCQENCGMTYMPVGPAPREFIKIGYYESWNQGWPCMNVTIGNLDLTGYTHIHYAFADIDPTTMTPTMDKFATQQFSAFTSITGVKKVLSFGGWSISTDSGTLSNLRSMVQPQNRAKAASNIASFATNNNLDGIDIDWEYPGADVSSGLPDDGGNYLAFLTALRNALPSSMTLSMAAPASYWYLRAFPIAEMSKVVDYIVYMTYDLHGQWDYGSQWTGQYLRSHVNWTETVNAVTLITTKAGVNSNKVLLGLGGYGRSFQMADPTCYGPMCTFTGTATQSNAEPGVCTKTAGYISLMEIDGIRAEGRVNREYVDAESQIMVYDTNQWVAFNTPDQLINRSQEAQAMNLAGTLVWAADLMQRDVTALGCQPEIMTYDEVMSGKCNVLPGLSKWVDNLIVAAPNVDTTIANQFFNDTDQRSFLVSQLKALKTKLQSNTTLTKRDTVDLVGTSYNYLYRSSVYTSMTSDGYLLSMDPDTTIDSAWKQIHIATNNHPNVIVMVNIQRAFKADVFITWLKNCGNIITSWLWSINYVIDMLQRCVSPNDFYNNNVENSLDWDPTDSSGFVISATAGTAITMPGLPSNVCPTGTGLNQLLIAGNILGGQASALQYKNKNNQPATCVMPIYYVNYYGDSHGVACNVFKYMSQRGQYVYNADRIGLRPARGSADSFFRLYNGCPPGYDLDEFPFNSMDNGYLQFAEWDVSVLCVLAGENRSDGVAYGNFLNAYSIWRRCDPDDPNSPLRGPLTQGQPFMVQIKNLNYNQCGLTTRTATMESRTQYNVRQYSSDYGGSVGTFWVYSRTSPGVKEYFEIVNKFYQLTMP